MPKIDAPSVREHRAAMSTKLVDAAEELLRGGEVDTLTAGAVASAVGIARNSLYRYVDSIDDLRGQVVARHLPGWVREVENAVAQAEDPMGRLLAYVSSNLEQAGLKGHGWLMRIARGLPAESLAEIDGAHRSLASMLLERCRELDPDGFELTAAFVQALLESALARLDAGDDPALVRQRCLQAVAAIVESRG